VLPDYTLWSRPHILFHSFDSSDSWFNFLSLQQLIPEPFHLVHADSESRPTTTRLLFFIRENPFLSASSVFYFYQTVPNQYGLASCASRRDAHNLLSTCNVICHHPDCMRRSGYVSHGYGADKLILPKAIYQSYRSWFVDVDRGAFHAPYETLVAR